jgi:hypothetical protein
MKAFGKLSIVASALLLLGLWAMPAHADHQGRVGPGFGGGPGRQVYGASPYGGFGHGGHGHGRSHFSHGHGGFYSPYSPYRYGAIGPSFGRSPYGGRGGSCYGSPGGNLGLYLPRFGLRLNF